MRNLLGILAGLTAMLLLCGLAILGVGAESLTPAGQDLVRNDVDGDGTVSISDVTSLLKCLSGTCGHVQEEGLCLLEKGRSNDVSEDSFQSIDDVTGLLSYLATRCGHVEVEKEDQPADCESGGLEGGSYCALCGLDLRSSVQTPSKGHDMKDGV